MKRIIIVIVAMLLVGVLAFIYFTKNSPDVQPDDGSLARVVERGTLIVGTNFPYGIMEFRDETGNPAGIDIEIAKEIAKALNVKVEIVDYPWDDLFVAVKSGSVDLALSSISITQERGAEMLFSTPYFSSGQVLITRKDTTGIESTKDLLNKKIGVQEGTTAQSGMEALGTNFEVIPYATGPELVQSLIRGDVNVIVTDYIEAITVVSGNPELLIRGTTFSHEFYGIASELGNNTLIERVNEVLRELKRTGRILEIERMFYSGAQ